MVDPFLSEGFLEGTCKVTIMFLEAVLNSVYFSFVGFREKRPLGKWMYQLTVFCTYIRNISSSKMELPRRLLKFVSSLFSRRSIIFLDFRSLFKQCKTEPQLVSTGSFRQWNFPISFCSSIKQALIICFFLISLSLLVQVSCPQLNSVYLCHQLSDSVCALRKYKQPHDCIFMQISTMHSSLLNHYR